MPYILLALLGLIPAALTIVRRRGPAPLATFFIAAALVDLADWIAYSCLDLYEYHPHLAAYPVLDETLGVILSEFIFVGSLTVLLVEHAPGWGWALVGAAVVTALQVAFARVGLLILHAWPAWLNAAAFVVYFWLMQAYHAALQRDGLHNAWLRTIAQAGVAGTFSALYALVQKVNQAFVIYINVLPTHVRNQSLARVILHLGVIIPLGVWVLRSPPANRTWRLAVATLVVILFNYARVALGLQRYRAPWNPVTDGLLVGLALAVAALVYTWIESREAWRPEAKGTL